MNINVSDKLNLFGGNDPFKLAEKFGTPLYVYNEHILRDRIRRLKKFVAYPNFIPLYSAKANSNLAILQIVCQEGLYVDAMSPGEIHAQLCAGFTPDKIFFVANNVSTQEMRFALDKGILISVDSVSQLEMLGRINPGGDVAIRFNGGVGAGHHQKVITAGKDTKFGVNPEFIPEVKKLLKEYNLTLKGINQHIGSLFMQSQSYIDGVKQLMALAKQFDDLSFIDFGGGFGIPYHKQSGEEPLNLEQLGALFDQTILEFVADYGKAVEIHIEPGRFIPAECCVLLGEVHSTKTNVKKYVGTDIGFNVLMRPVLYDSHHDIEVYQRQPTDKTETVTIVGNICESGDILASGRELPLIKEHDIIGVLDAGAYGQSMSSTYNNRQRPAELLIREDGELTLIRSRDTLDDLLLNYIKLQL